MTDTPNAETRARIAVRFTEAREALDRTADSLAGRLADAVGVVVAAYRQGGRVFLFGNGGSAADAQHIAGELVGRFLAERRPLPAEALSTDPSVLTALANDYGYDRVFARQIEAKARPGDVAVGLTTSGDSANVVAALAAARRLDVRTVAFTGPTGGRCAEHADVLLDVPAETSPRIQEAHAVLYHILCEMVEAAVADAD